MVRWDLQKWSAIAEILSSIAVLATLVFLVFEIRQNTDAIRANTYQDLNAVISESNAAFLTNPEFSEFIARTADSEVELVRHEALRLRAFISSMYRHADNIYFQYEIGTIDRRQMESLLYPMVLNIQRRSRLLAEWETGADRLLLNPVLAAYIDSEIRKAGSQ